MSEARKRILNMLAQGKITVEQSEELLSALESDDKAKAKSDMDEKRNEGTGETSGSRESGETAGEAGDSSGQGGKGFRFPFGPNFGADVENFAGQIQKQFGKAFRGIQPQSQELKGKLKDFGGWLSEAVGKIVCDMHFPERDLPDGVEIEAMIAEPQGFSNCRITEVNNLHGSISIREGEVFGLKIRGRISRAALGDQSASAWFAANAIQIHGDRMVIGMDKSSTVKAVLDIELFLPSHVHLQLHTFSAPVTVYGPFRILAAEAVSGDLKFTHCLFEDTALETVSANIIVEGGALAMRVKMTSGDLNISGARVEKLAIQTVSGDVSLSDLTLSDGAELDVATTSGDISMRRPQGQVARLEARSRTGQVHARVPGNRQPIDKFGIVIETGEAGARIKAESVSGDLLFD
ncbi:MAG: DUF4097 family beta strand repeat-containing protein [Candidatus Ozemobacteraceae bacterium]